MIGFERKLLLEIKPLVLNKGVFNTQFRARLSNTDEQKERAQCCSASSGYSDANFEHTVSEGKKENRSKVQVRQRYSPTYGRKQKERRLEGENPSQFGTNPKDLPQNIGLDAISEETKSTIRLLELNKASLNEYQTRQVIEAAAKNSLPEALVLISYLPLSGCKAWEVLLKICESRRSRKGLLLVIQRMCEDRRLKTVRMQHTALITAFRALARMNLSEEAIALFKRNFARNGKNETVPQVLGNTFLNAISSDSDLSFNWFEILLAKGFQPNQISFNTLLKSCMRARDIQKAEAVKAMMSERQIQGDEYTYNSLIKMFQYANDPLGALQVKDLMDSADFKPTPSILGSLIVVCGQKGSVEQGYQIWRKIISDGDKPTVDCLNALMNAFADAFQGDRALKLFHEAKTLGLQGTIWTYNVAIKSCGSPPGIPVAVSQFEEALGFLKEIQEIGLAPDIVTYTEFFSVCAKAKQGERAFRLYQEIFEAKTLRMDTQAGTSLINALVSSKMVDEAISVYHKMVWGPSSMKPNEKTYRLMIGACRENDRLEKAIEIYKSMRSQGFKPSNSDLRALTAACAEKTLLTNDTVLPSKLVNILGLGGKYELDLHGLSEFEARATVLCGLRSVQLAYEAGVPLSSDFVIITGHGVHSDVNEGPKLRSAIQKLLSKELHILPEKNIENNLNGLEVILKAKPKALGEDGIVLTLGNVESGSESANLAGLTQKRIMRTLVKGDMARLKFSTAKLEELEESAYLKGQKQSSENVENERLESFKLDSNTIKKMQNKGRIVVSKRQLQAWLSEKVRRR